MNKTGRFQNFGLFPKITASSLYEEWDEFPLSTDEEDAEEKQQNHETQTLFGLHDCCWGRLGDSEQKGFNPLFD